MGIVFNTVLDLLKATWDLFVALWLWSPIQAILIAVMVIGFIPFVKYTNRVLDKKVKQIPFL